eukprot:TRINITY_DN59383_c0_g1_i1.p1 TRINITY_DN59383_c0_g1~~TRINITY_DN59383_c0_g1_i1.p1  ORF type:complete len:488 (+),score=92.17 TRINITY_DN59383_c0_g1_i1:82-1464(+)
MARVLADVHSARSATHLNLHPVSGLPVHQAAFRRTSSSVLGDITNTGFGGLGVKPFAFVENQQAVAGLPQVSEVASIGGGAVASSFGCLATGPCRLASLPAGCSSRPVVTNGPTCAPIVPLRERAEVIVAHAGRGKAEEWTVDWSESWGVVLNAAMEGRRIEDYTVFNRNNQVIKIVANIPNRSDFPLRIVPKDGAAEDDSMQVEDPRYVAEYAKDIFVHLSDSESSFQPRPGFLDAQTDINSKMRAILVDWLVEVHMKYKLKPETLFMAVNLVDRFLEQRLVLRKRLQLVGVTAMFIAAKFEEIYPPEIKDFVYITDNAYTKGEIQEMEVGMLAALNFELCCPTVAHYLDNYQSLTKCKEEQFHLMQYVAELCLPEVKMLRYLPSHLVAAAALLSNKILKHRPAWPECMSHIPADSQTVVKACARDMCGLLEGAERNQLQAVRRKYSQAKFSSVAKMTF